MTKTDDYLNLVKPWKVGEGPTLLKHRLFSVRERLCSSQSDPRKKGQFVYLDTGDWVNVLALTPHREIILVEQFRHGLKKVTLEIPGGMVDAGESPLDAGLRELREETGYVGENARIIGFVEPNPAIQNNRCHTVLVEQVLQKHTPTPDAHEELAVRLSPLDAIPGLIQRGIIAHALVVSAFHHLVLQKVPSGEVEGVRR